jgi:hypothetical protein
VFEAIILLEIDKIENFTFLTPTFSDLEVIATFVGTLFEHLIDGAGYTNLVAPEGS